MRETSLLAAGSAPADPPESGRLESKVADSRGVLHPHKAIWAGLTTLITLVVAACSPLQVSPGVPDVYVVDGDNRLVRIASGGRGGTTTLEGHDGDRFDGAGGVAVDSRRRIYVTDFRKNRLVRVDNMTGKGWTTLGREGGDIHQFFRPQGIGIDQSDRI